ncbi:hypothetical protein D3C84_860380 [compost metagenome]
MASAMASRAVARCAGVVRDQPAKARWAACTAASTCSSEASAMDATASPVAGLMMVSARPSPSTSWPSISKALCRGVLADIFGLLLVVASGMTTPCAARSACVSVPLRLGPDAVVYKF